MWLLVLSTAIFVAYQAAFLRWKGATPGKLALGMRVRLRDRSGRLPWGTIGARLALPQLVPGSLLRLPLATGSFAIVALVHAVVVLIGLLDPLWATWDDKRQALHDELARTNVVKTR